MWRARVAKVRFVSVQFSASSHTLNIAKPWLCLIIWTGYNMDLCICSYRFLEACRSLMTIMALGQQEQYIKCRHKERLTFKAEKQRQRIFESFTIFLCSVLHFRKEHQSLSEHLKSNFPSVKLGPIWVLNAIPSVYKDTIQWRATDLVSWVLELYLEQIHGCHHILDCCVNILEDKGLEPRPVWVCVSLPVDDPHLFDERWLPRLSSPYSRHTNT